MLGIYNFITVMARIGLEKLVHEKATSIDETGSYTLFRSYGPNLTFKGRTTPPFDTIAHHMAFLSRNDSGFICFYGTHKSLIKGVHDKMRIGKYIKKYYPNYSDDEIRLLVAECHTLQSRYEFELISDAEEGLQAIRQAHDEGVARSCMSYPLREYSTAYHPYLVLLRHDDINVAIVRDKRREIICARALVNTRTNEYPMVYGDWEIIEKFLTREGFTHGDFQGMYFDVDYCNGTKKRIICPYIDGHRSLDRSHYEHEYVQFDSDDMTIYISPNGYGTSADATGGTIRVNENIDFCSDCEEEFDISDHEHIYVDGHGYVGGCCRDEYVSVIYNRYGDTRYMLVGLDYIETACGEYFSDESIATQHRFYECTDGEYRHADSVTFCYVEDITLIVQAVDANDANIVKSDCGSFFENETAAKLHGYALHNGVWMDADNIAA